MTLSLPRLLVAAPGSGGGKTTVTCGLLQLFGQLGLAPAAFKCGPDYIDPLFHRRIVGAKSGNLDLFFTDEPTARALLARGAEGCGIAVLEGVMGYYDGISSGSPEGSSYHVASATATPVLLVLDSHGASLSLAAQIYGFAHFQPGANICGVLLNRCSEALFRYLAPALEKATGIPVLGYLPQDERFAIQSRHLGLVTAAEITGLKAKMRQLAETLRQTVDVDKLLAMAKAAPALEYEPYITQQVTPARPRLAVAQDRAFCFYYSENLRMLEDMGAELVRFSPLHGGALPADVDGLYLGGGYPELCGRRLAGNEPMRGAIRQAVAGGMPTVAECGGFMYLQEELTDDKGRRWPMLGLLPGRSQNAKRLKHFGYITVTAGRGSLYGPAGESIRAHEFHYWHSSADGDAFHAKKPGRETNWPCIVATDTLVAGFPHLYYPANPEFAANFVRAMAAYSLRQGW